MSNIYKICLTTIIVNYLCHMFNYELIIIPCHIYKSMLSYYKISIIMLLDHGLVIKNNLITLFSLRYNVF